MFGSAVTIATVIGNVVAALYYIFYYLRGQSSLSISIKEFSVKEKVFSRFLDFASVQNCGIDIKKC